MEHVTRAQEKVNLFLPTGGTETSFPRMLVIALRAIVRSLNKIIDPEGALRAQCGYFDSRGDSMSRRGRSSRDKRQQPTQSAKDDPQPRSLARRYATQALAGLTLVLLVAAIIISANTGGGPAELAFDADGQAKVVAVTHAYRTDGPRKLNALLKLDEDELAELDIALINLVCAEGLPGSDGLDIDGILATLDAWAEHVYAETERNLYRFYADPGAWDGSEARWRMAMLVTALQQDCGVHYNPDRVREVDFTRSEDLFIHGMAQPGMEPIQAATYPEQAEALLSRTNGGTCVSMPVLYAAIARRLGYPVTLSSTQAHVFCRWDGTTSGGHENRAYRDYFNIEGTNRGINIYDDAHYLTFPVSISEEFAKAHGFLESESNAATLAAFMATRGHCLLDTGRARQAYDAYREAVRLDPDQPYYQQFMQQAASLMLPREARTAMLSSDARRAGQSRQNFADQELPRINRINAENRRLMEQQLQWHQQDALQQADPGYIDPWASVQPNTYQPPHQGY